MTPRIMIEKIDKLIFFPRKKLKWNLLYVNLEEMVE
jgi:hypothetical protein